MRTITTPSRVTTGRTPASARVLDAGIDLFFDAGFLATSIRDITARCKMTAAAFYNHFESKEALLYTIVSEANGLLEARIDELELDESDPGGSLAALVHALVTFNLTFPKQARIANREYVMLRVDHRNEVINHRRRVRTLFEKVLSSDKVARGLVRADGRLSSADLEIRLLAISIINISIAASDWFHGNGTLSISEFADAHGRLALRMAGFTRSLAGPNPAVSTSDGTIVPAGTRRSRSN